MNDLAIIIVNYHCHKLVKECVKSVQKFSTSQIHIILVDNSVPPETEKLEKELPGIVVLSVGKNIGFAAACNLGINYAKSIKTNYYLLLNPDTRTESDFISPMLKTMQLKPELGMLSPKILKDNTTRDVWFSPGKINWWRGKLNHDNSTITENGDPITAQFLTGCAMLLRASSVDQVGLMEEKYFLYFEDTDYCLAFQKAGWNIGYLPEAQILHAQSSTTGYLSELYLYYFSRNQTLFMKKWASIHHLLFFQLTTMLVMIPAAVAYFGVFKKDPKRMKAYISGCIDGFKGKTGSREKYKINN